MNCPACKTELVRLGIGKDGIWIAGKVYRCGNCPSGENRFTMDGHGRPVKEIKAA